MRIFCIRFFSVFSLLFGGVYATEYKLIALDLSGEHSSVHSINDQGQIVGTLSKEGKDYIFFWDPKTGSNVVETDLGNAFIAKINNAGTVFFSRAFCGKGDVYIRVFEWDNPWSNTQFQELDLHTENAQKYRLMQFNINDIGQVLLVYESRESDWKHYWKNYVYENGNLNLIKSPEPVMGMAINNNSQIAGVNLTIEGFQAVVYDYKDRKTYTFDEPNGAIFFDINDKGQVLGNLVLSATNGSFLGNLENTDRIILNNIFGTKMNNHGQIVGILTPSGVLNIQHRTVGVIWDNGNETKLSDISLVDDKGHTWDSLDALYDINDQGQIVGNGTYNGEQHGFLLIPVK